MTVPLPLRRRLSLRILNPLKISCKKKKLSLLLWINQTERINYHQSYNTRKIKICCLDRRKVILNTKLDLKKGMKISRNYKIMAKYKSSFLKNIIV